MCSTASARPRCCRRFCRTGRATIRYGSTGKPVPGYDVKIVDESGAELPDGEIGELLVRGPSAGEGYWNQRAKVRRTFAGEWTYTGDKYYRDRDGYYFYCGRTDDMFKVSGMWVSPFDVEAALISHEAVLEAAVIPKEDADGLIKPKAFVVLKNGHADDAGAAPALKEHVKARAGTWKYPRWIELRERPAAHRDRQGAALQVARGRGGAAGGRECSAPHNGLRTMGTVASPIRIMSASTPKMVAMRSAVSAASGLSSATIRPFSNTRTRSA